MGISPNFGNFFCGTDCWPPTEYDGKWSFRLSVEVADPAAPNILYWDGDSDVKDDDDDSSTPNLKPDFSPDSTAEGENDGSPGAADDKVDCGDVCDEQRFTCDPGDGCGGG